MATAFWKIGSVTVGAGGSSSIQFNSIPQTYTDLKLVLSLRTNDSTTSDYAIISLNSSTSNFSAMAVGSTGTANFGATWTGDAARIVSEANGDGSLSNAFSIGEVNFFNYSGNTYKTIVSDSSRENNSTSAEGALVAMLWQNTSAITSITLNTYSSGKVFMENSTATLYGIATS